MAKRKYANQCFEGYTFCISGTLSKVRREFIKLIESHGGTWSTTVNKEVDFLVTVPQHLTRKMRSAVDLGVPMVTEDFLHDCIDAGRMVNSRKYRLRVNMEDEQTEESDSGVYVWQPRRQSKRRY